MEDLGKQIAERDHIEEGLICVFSVLEPFNIGDRVRVTGILGLYRYGGDEFCVSLKNFTLEEAAVTAERIRAEIESGNPGGEINVTASIGVASSSQLEGSQGGEDLLDLADKAAYQSKNAGSPGNISADVSSHL